jgi:hypothetical protein
MLQQKDVFFFSYPYSTCIVTTCEKNLRKKSTLCINCIYKNSQLCLWYSREGRRHWAVDWPDPPGTWNTQCPACPPCSSGLSRDGDRKIYPFTKFRKKMGVYAFKKFHYVELQNFE